MSKITALFASKPLQIALIVAALAIAIYWYGGNAAVEKQKNDPKLPNNGQGIPTNWNPEPRASALFEVMNGIGSTADKESEWAICMSLTDDQLTAVYGAFNRRYCAGDDQTLTTWIKWETGAWFGSVKPALLQRLRSLNLN